MSNTPYKKTRERISVFQFRIKFLEKYGKIIGPEYEDKFPPGVWPKIRRLYKVGKLTKDLKIPIGAKPEDYPLAALCVIKKAGIEFPGYEFGEFPEDFLNLVQKTVRAKYMDAYGKVSDPIYLSKIPKKLWPYVRTTGTIGNTVGLILKDEDPEDYPPGLIKYANAIRKTK
ncbi:MAG: hypothetical protein Q4C49_01415 [Bacillota bacterium]|nr:hypothetical protein [Bacillota bacterium]